MTGPAREQLSALDVATGFPVGGVSGPTPPREPGDVRAALAAAVLPALEREPCGVSFSGGRDSSAVLAVATTLARDHGLADPLPITLRYPGVAEAEESEWQEMVVRHLGLREWVKVEIRGELDFLGDIATDMLRRHGLLWPGNVHTHVPVFREVPGGSLLNGLDGDGLLGDWRWGQARNPRLRDFREPRRVAKVALARAPRAIRRLHARRREPPPLPWLTPAAAFAHTTAWRTELATEPTRWDRRVAWYARRRYLRIALDSLDVLGDDQGVLLVSPLLDPGVLAAVARTGGRTGFLDRTSAMTALFGDLLPEALLGRRSKATFGEPFWGPRVREFARTWSGDGVDPSLVEPAVLRGMWAGQTDDHFGSLALLHRAWLAQHPDKAIRR